MITVRVFVRTFKIRNGILEDHSFVDRFGDHLFKCLYIFHGSVLINIFHEEVMVKPGGKCIFNFFEDNVGRFKFLF